jgi:uncharacterized protein (TIGR02453 family)
MAFGGFGKGAFAFYDDLEANNSRDWWLANKRRYEDEIRRPMEELLQEVSGEFGEAKLFRPNRDTRFSKDKSPYKTNIAAVIYLESGGSVYVSLGADGLHVGGGSYHLERTQLAQLREAIDDDRSGKQIAKIVADLRKATAEVTAHDAVKTAPRGYSPDHPRIDLLRLGGLAAMFAHRPAAWIHTPKAKDRIVDGWHRLQPLNTWLAKHT